MLVAEPKKKSRMGRPPTGKVLIGFKLTPELAKMIRETAAANGQENSELVEAAVRDWLSQGIPKTPLAASQTVPRASQAPSAPPALQTSPEALQTPESASSAHPGAPQAAVTSELAQKIAQIGRHLGVRQEELIESILEKWVKKALITGSLRP
jgi:hypothetical protein